MYTEYLYNNSLAHHGIKGQRWGIRRFQNEDGSLTPEGRARYDVDIEGAKTRVKQTKQQLKKAEKKYKYAPIEKNRKAYAYALNENDFAKQDLKTEKAKNKLNKETKSKSKHRQKLEAKYIEQGMSPEEAEIAAYKRAKTEKILIATGAIAVTALAAYVAYNHYDKTVDKLIDTTKTPLHNISIDSNKGVEDAFYASYTKGDRLKYRGLYADTLSGTIKTGKKDVFDTTISSKNGKIKVASEKTGKEVLQDLYKNDPEFRKDFEKKFGRDHMQNLMNFSTSDKKDTAYREGYKALQEGKVDKHVFDAFNNGLVDHSPDSQKVIDKYYNELKKRGYDAIIDVNDKRLSGYNAKHPMIVFNGKDKLNVDSVKKLSEGEIIKDFNKSNARLVAQETARSFATTTAPGTALLAGGTAAIKGVSKSSQNKIVQDYRKEHPNTKLSYNEILRNELRKRNS